MFLDIQAVQSAGFAERGIARFTNELSRALVAHDAPVAAFALNRLKPFPRRLHRNVARAPQLVWNTATAFRRAVADGPLQYVVLSPYEDLRPVDGARPAEGVLAPHVSGVPVAVMVYDLIPEVCHYYPSSGRTARTHAARRSWIRQADLLLTLSEQTRRDIVERWSVPAERIAVIGAAASPFFSPPNPGEAPAQSRPRTTPAVTRPFVLSIGGSLWHKNMDTLLEAWARLDRRIRGDHQLVLVCTLSQRARTRLTERIREIGLEADSVVLTGFVADETLRDLYRSAELFVLPSHYEGFGLPVLEAASSGCLAICSNAAALPEVLDWPDATFPPSDADAMGALIERALSDSDYRSALGAVCRRLTSSHSWERTAQRLVDACATLSARPPPARRARLALVGAFPPDPSPRAITNVRTAQALATRCTLDCFVESPGGDVPPHRGRRLDYRVFPARSLGNFFSPATYDAVVYAVGKPGYQSVVTRRLAEAYPGIVLADDQFAADVIPASRATVIEREPELAATTLLALARADVEPLRPREAPAPREEVTAR
jgi:glycosyltransferase involved in cell wall biosynthesis